MVQDSGLEERKTINEYRVTLHEKSSFADRLKKCLYIRLTSVKPL